MATAPAEPLADLYLADETAWLDITADLIRRRELAAVDLDNLAEFLTDMANRDRRQVLSRLIVLIAHLLKWEFQPEKRTRSWLKTVITQQQELEGMIPSGVLRVHALNVLNVLDEAYQKAVARAVAEIGLPPTAFPPACPFTVEQLLAVQPSTDGLT